MVCITKFIVSENECLTWGEFSVVWVWCFNIKKHNGSAVRRVNGSLLPPTHQPKDSGIYSTCSEQNSIQKTSNCKTCMFTHTHTSTHTETNCGTHSLLPLCWRRTRVFWVGVFRHKLPYCQRKNKINRYKAETGWSAAAVYCSDSYASSTVITVSCWSVLHWLLCFIHCYNS